MAQAVQISEIIFYAVSVVAIIAGFTAWRRDLKGKNRYECAKNVIVGAYRLREEINRCRAAFMYPSEWEGRTQKDGESEHERRTGESYFAYGRRYNRIIDALNAWQPYLIEAEALFGSKARETALPMHKVISKLRSIIDLYHQMRLERECANQSYKNYENVIYGIHPAMEDRNQPERMFDDGGFQTQLDNAVESIKEYYTQFIK